jgi:hypothetical protein
VTTTGFFNGRFPFLALILSLAGAASASCASKTLMESTEPASSIGPKGSRPYEQVIERYSAGDSEYTGFNNAFEYKATILNSEVREAIIERQAKYYLWDREKMAIEREKAQSDLAKETQVHVSFFTPEKANDNLTDAKSIWRVYLDTGGRRYQGRVKRIRGVMAELQSLYPYHTRWTTPYEVAFPVPALAIETQSATLIITGPLGTRSVDFPPVR